MTTVEGQVEQDIPQGSGLDCSGQVLTEQGQYQVTDISFQPGIEIEMREELEAPSVAVGYELTRVSSGPVFW